jgi:tetratricopeptide (TPR) repeat protein
MTRPGTRLGQDVAALVLLAALVASCAPKATVPSVATAPRFPDFVYPAAPRELAKGDLAGRQQRAWQFLQAGDLKTSRREFTTTLQRNPAFYPADAGLAYVSLAEKNYLDALSRFDRVLVGAARYAPALAGRGDALVGTGRIDEAVRSFQAALAADASLADVKRRLDVLALRTQQQAIASARQAAEAGRFDEAAAAYERAIASSPDSAFLFRELGSVERRQGRAAEALQNVRKALTLDPSDARTYLLLGELFEDRGDTAAAVDAFSKAQDLEPGDETSKALARARAAANSTRLPEEYRAIPTAAQVTRADLAALLGVRLSAFLQTNAKPDTRVVTDVRGHWAATWIMAVVRAGVMEPYQNHAFTPRGVVRRVDLAQVVSRVLTLVAAKRPAQGRQWLAARPQMTDMPAGHLGYPAAAVAVGSGVMALDGSGFRPSRVVTGAEAIDVIGKLEVLVK